MGKGREILWTTWNHNCFKYSLFNLAQKTELHLHCKNQINEREKQERGEW